VKTHLLRAFGKLGVSGRTAAVTTAIERGLLPALEGPWRYISGQLYFAVMARLAGLDPFPYRAVSLAAHAATAALLCLVLRRWQAPLR